MKTIVLNITNFHGIFKDKIIKNGDVVENLRSGGKSVDLIVKINENDPQKGYVLVGHSKDAKGIIIERKYWERENISYEITNRFSPNSKESQKYLGVMQ